MLVSIQMANGEVGAVNHIAKLAALAHEAGALFHTDAVQALGKVPVDLVALGVDAASFVVLLYDCGYGSGSGRGA